MKSFNLAVIAGDGIGPEVVNEGLKVLDTVAKKYDLNFNKTNYELGAAYWHKTGETLPDSGYLLYVFAPKDLHDLI